MNVSDHVAPAEAIGTLVDDRRGRIVGLFHGDDSRWIPSLLLQAADTVGGPTLPVDLDAPIEEIPLDAKDVTSSPESQNGGAQHPGDLVRRSPAIVGDPIGPSHPRP
jgi:hypothetical protein